jgi:hypothetical protein
LSNRVAIEQPAIYRIYKIVEEIWPVKRNLLMVGNEIEWSNSPITGEILARNFGYDDLIAFGYLFVGIEKQ